MDVAEITVYYFILHHFKYNQTAIEVICTENMSNINFFQSLK